MLAFIKTFIKRFINECARKIFLNSRNDGVFNNPFDSARNYLGAPKIFLPTEQ